MSASDERAKQMRLEAQVALRPETREAFLKAIEGLRAAGATVIFDESILPDSFAETASRVCTFPYVREGTERFLQSFGPAQYHSAAEYEKAVGSPLPATILSGFAQEIYPGAEDRSRSASWRLTRRRKPFTTRLGGVPWKLTTKFSKDCTWMDLCIPRRKCLLRTKPCRRTAV